MLINYSVNDLDSVLMFVIDETVMQDFKNSEGVDLQMLLNNILMPFFQILTRILEKNTYFNIGDVQFHIPATTPFDFGKVNATTTIRLTQAVSNQTPLDRLIIVPTKRHSISRHDLLNNIL